MEIEINTVEKVKLFGVITMYTKLKRSVKKLPELPTPPVPPKRR